MVSVSEGSSANASYRQTAVNGTLGTTAIVWADFGASVGPATETTAGKAEIATQAETDGGTDDQRFVTPLKQANWSGRKLKFSQTVGDGSATQFTVTHNLNTRDLVGNVYRNSGAFDVVLCDIEYTTVNTATVRFAAAPSSNQFRAAFLG